MILIITVNFLLVVFVNVLFLFRIINNICWCMNRVVWFLKFQIIYFYKSIYLLIKLTSCEGVVDWIDYIEWEIICNHLQSVFIWQYGLALKLRFLISLRVLYVVIRKIWREANTRLFIEGRSIIYKNVAERIIVMRDWISRFRILTLRHLHLVYLIFREFLNLPLNPITHVMSMLSVIEGIAIFS